MVFEEHAQPLGDRRQTAAEIKRLVKLFADDLDLIFVSDVAGNKRALSTFTLREFFDFVRKIPYKRDREPVEVIGRPLWIAGQVSKGSGIDCKKKSVLMGAFFEKSGRPYRFIGSSTRPDKQIHHIFPQVLIAGEWLNADATYARNRFGAKKEITKGEIL